MDLDNLSEEDKKLLTALLRQESQTQGRVSVPQQQPSSGGPSPGMAMNFIPQQGAASGGGQGAGMGAAAWPAALAAAIIANETYQNKQGNRPDEFKDHMKELATGEVLERDAKKYIGGPVGDFVGTMGSPEGMATHIKKSLKPWEWFT